MKSYIISEAFESLASKSKINEDFSSSMPQWLKIYLLDSGSRRAGVKNRYRLDLDRQNLRAINRDIGRDSRSELPDYQLKERNIDYSRANFITVDPPPSIPEMLSDPSKMYLVYLKSENDETIWSPGFSPKHEKFRLTNDKIISLNNLNNKTYRSLVQDVCYLDLNDTNNYKIDLQISRDNAKKDVVDRNRIAGERAELSSTGVAWSSYSGKNYDKSGYLKPDLLKKYSDLLRQRKFPKLNQKIKEVKEMVDQLVDANILEQYRNTDYINKDEVRNAIRHFYNIVDYFESMVRISNDNTVPYDSLASSIQDLYNDAFRQYNRILSSGYVVVPQKLPADIDNSQIDDIDNWNDFM